MAILRKKRGVGTSKEKRLKGDLFVFISCIKHFVAPPPPPPCRLCNGVSRYWMGVWGKVVSICAAWRVLQLRCGYRRAFFMAAGAAFISIGEERAGRGEIVAQEGAEKR